MINNTLRQLITEEVEKLPGYKRVIFNQFDWVHELETIAIKYGFSGEKENIVVSEAAMAILGVTDPEDLASEFKKQLLLDDTTLANMVGDIADRVALRIQKELDTMMGDLGPFVQQEIEDRLRQDATLANIGLTISDTPILTDTIPTPDDKMKKTMAMEEKKVASYDQKDPYHEPVE